MSSLRLFEVDKRCSVCRVTKALEDFYIRRNGKPMSECKGCHRANVNARRIRRGEAHLRYKRDAYAKHAKEINARRKARYWQDPEKYRAEKRVDHQKHRDERVAKLKRWIQENPAKHRDQTRRTALKRNAIKQATLVAHITADQLAAKVAYWGDCCWICRSPWVAIDHVKPLSKGGAHVLANLRPACTRCNRRKQARWPFPTTPEAARATIAV